MAIFQDERLTKDKLSALWEDSAVEILPTRKKRYAIISDLHLGDGGPADDFRHNENAMLSALDRYYNEKYILILLGDIEEFWQFELRQIVARYEDTFYKKIRRFGDKRVYRIYGNHDSEWAMLTDPTRNHSPKVQFAAEALKLRDVSGDVRMLLVHGHQGTKNSDKNSWASRFFVRLFKTVKPVAKRTRIYPSYASETKSQVAKNYERTYYSWAKETQVVVICGHTHRAMFASRPYAARLQDEIDRLEQVISENAANTRTMLRLRRLRRALRDEQKKERDIEVSEATSNPLPCYFNSGCSLYSDGITILEVEDDEIRLVKWRNESAHGSRFQVYESGSISSFLGRLNGKE